jgi:putative membrane protein
MGALGALLTFSGQIWYPAYGDSSLFWHLTSLEDQQLGGLIMWIPGGLVYFAVGLALSMRWLGGGQFSAAHS